MKTDCRNWCRLFAALLILLGGISGRANVYATDIKLNGSTNNAAIVPSGLVQISYILNEPADAGLSVQIYSSASIVWTNHVAGGVAGTGAGSNSMVWGATNQSGQKVAAGVYQISITAASAGHAGWTNITDDNNPNFQVTVPSGIAVNKNTNSPYYGRVFVSDAVPAESGAPGIFISNADGSPADEGGFSNGGYPWSAGYGPAGSLYSPWKIAVAGDDRVYIDDWSASGIVLSFDEVISTNYLTALDAGNYPDPDALLSGPWVTGSGTNTQIWMADDFTNNSVGLVRWDVTTNGMVASNDMGTVVVGISSNGLNLGPYDVSVDTNGNIYTIQSLDGVDDASKAAMPRVFRFPPFTGQTNLVPVWSLGSADQSLEYAYGIAVDPTARFVAVAVRGWGPSGVNYVGHNGAVNIYQAADGGLVTRLGTNDEFIAVAWDNAGNLYAGDFTASVWRAYSPPGTNQATTTAVPIIQVYDALTPPQLSVPFVPPNQFGFTLSGQSNVTYVIESSPDLVNWTPVATNYDVVPVRTVTVPMPGAASFFQAVAP